MPTKTTKTRFVEKYGDIEVKFYSYYKYTFSYMCDFNDDKRIIVRVGGSSEEIYRLSVDEDGISIKALEYDITSGGVYMNGEAIESFYDE